MLIGCTKETARKTGITLCAKDLQEEDFYCWHVKLFEVRGGQMFLFMNDLTRFPVLMHYNNNENMDSLYQRFACLFEEVVAHLPLPRSLAHAYLDQQEFTCTKVFDFSIMSQVNALSRLYRYNALYSVHKFHNDTEATINYAHIPSFKYDLYPYQVMKEELTKRFLNENFYEKH